MYQYSYIYIYIFIAEVVILILENGFQDNEYNQQKEGHFTIIRGPIHWKNKTIIFMWY